jgi:hypothetical protein
MRLRRYFLRLYGGINRFVCVRGAFDIRTHRQDSTEGGAQWSLGHRSLWCLRLLACRPRTPSQQFVAPLPEHEFDLELGVIGGAFANGKGVEYECGGGYLEFSLSLSEDKWMT